MVLLHTSFIVNPTRADYQPGGFLQAVIEEARRHARRRRVRYGLLLVILSAAGVATYASLGGGGTGSALGTGRALPRGAVGAGRALPRNGALVLSTEFSGWYGINGVDAASGRVRALTQCPVDVTLCGEPESVDWAPDGKRLAIGLSPTHAGSLTWQLLSPRAYDGLHVLDVRTDRDRELVRPGEHAEDAWLDVDWAPDGRHLAYATNNGDIAVISADGSGHRILDTGADLGFKSMPSWSPDGRWIAYASVEAGGPSSVYVIRADGSGRRLLAHHAAAPAWSPDGTQIAVRGPHRVEFISPEGGLRGPRSVGINGTPAWSPDATKVAVATARSGIWIMNADGTDLSRLAPYYGDTEIRLEDVQRPAWRPRH